MMPSDRLVPCIQNARTHSAEPISTMNFCGYWAAYYPGPGSLPLVSVSTGAFAHAGSNQIASGLRCLSASLHGAQTAGLREEGSCFLEQAVCPLGFTRYSFLANSRNRAMPNHAEGSRDGSEASHRSADDVGGPLADHIAGEVRVVDDRVGKDATVRDPDPGHSMDGEVGRDY